MELVLLSVAMYSSLAWILFSIRPHISWLTENSIEYTEFALIAPGVLVGTFLALKFVMFTLRSFRRIFFIDLSAIFSSLNSFRRLKNYAFTLQWLLRKNNTLKQELITLKAELEETNFELKNLVATWTPRPVKKETEIFKTTTPVKPKRKSVTPALMEYDFVDSYAQMNESNGTDDGTWADYSNLY